MCDTYYYISCVNDKIKSPDGVEYEILERLGVGTFGQVLKCKVIYNDDEIISVEYDVYKKREIKTFKLIEDNNINYSKKYLNRDNINKLFLQIVLHHR